MTKIDFHTHILPATDDGPKSLDISLQMLAKLKEQSVDTVVLTSHYYSHVEPIEKFVRRREKAYQALISAANETIAFRLGAEVYFTEYLFNNKDLSALCIDGTRTMLLELPFRKIDDRLIGLIERLSFEYMITPVLAHIERYPQIIKSKGLMNYLLDMGCVFQVNLSSFTAFRKRRLLSLLKNGYIGAIGTDSHNLDNRPPDYDGGYARLSKVLSADELAVLQNNMLSLLNVN